MLKLRIIHILHLSAILVPIAANFDFKIHYCEFKCSWGVCEAEDAPEEVKEKAKITGFYWRDYHGVIPDDAFPLGESTQSPRSFAGLVNDIESNGTFATTIFEGIDYVYTIFNGRVRKLNDDIQILCTQEPDKMKWVHLTDQKLTNIVFVQAGIEYTISKTTINRFLARVTNCNLNYASSIQRRTDTLEYAVIDGTSRNETYFELLYYDKSADATTETNKKEETKAKKKTSGGSSFFKHQYEYAINPNSIIPSFYKKIKAGPCSVVCTNRDKQNKDGHNKQGKTDISLDYFWMPSAFFTKTFAIETGVSVQGATLYSAQAWIYPIGRDVGETTDGKSAEFPWDNAVFITNTDIKILSTTVPQKFYWSPSNSSEFKTINTTKIIRGGTLLNGTKTYVGRVKDGNVLTTGSIRVFDSSIYAFYNYFVPSVETNFDVLLHV